jgi:hypothetical protein
MVWAVTAVGVMVSGQSRGSVDGWMLWAEGTPPDFDGVVAWVKNAAPTCDKLTIRLMDPDAPNGSGDAFKLDNGMNAGVLQFMKSIRDEKFAGEVAVLPYFDGNWVWEPSGTTTTHEWEKPFYWAQQANAILAGAGVSQGFFEVNFENENSGGILQVDDATLLAVQTFQKSVWPSLSQSPGFIGLAATKGYTSALNMLRWTTVPLSGSGMPEPPLASGVLELYNMAKCCPGGGDNCETTFVDAYSTVPQTPNPSPASPQTIYTRAAAAADPVTDILGTPTASCPTQSDFGFLFGNKAPPCSGSYAPPDCMTGADMSRVWLMFSSESTSLGTIDAFGTWSAQPGSGASVETFKTFCGKFDDAFYTHYWNAGSPGGDAQPPRYAIFQYARMPDSWKPSTIADVCNADLDGSGQVDLGDILAVIDGWMTEAGDVNDDGETDVTDLLIVLEYYGGVC